MIASNPVAGPERAEARHGTDAVGRYAAFLSYSHSLDGALAPALQTSLEQFGRVWFRRRALRLFRDSTNLAATPHLWVSIEEALRSSAWFVLLASPESARSLWVQRELDWWLENRSADRVLVAVTAGSVAWDPDTGRVDPSRTNALPPAFGSRGLPEPLWVDLRALRTADPSDPAYQAAVVDIAVALHGRPKDDLVGEQIRQHRKRRRSIALAAIALVLLTLVASITAVVAVVQQNRAEAQTRVAIARQLLTQADAARPSDPRTALLLGEAAQHIRPGPESVASLIQTLSSTRYEAALADHVGAVWSVAFSPDGHVLATAGADRTVLLWDVRNPSQPRRIGPPLTGQADTIEALAFSPDGLILAAGSWDKTVLLWDIGNPAAPRRIGAPLSGATGQVQSLAFSPDGRTLASSGSSGPLLLWDLADPAQPRLQSSIDSNSGFGAVAFAPVGRLLATSGASGAAQLWDVTDPARPHSVGDPFTGHVANVDSVAFARDGRILATASEDGTAQLWDVHDPRSPRPLGRLSGHTDAVASVAFSPDGHTVATASWDQSILLWNIDDPARPRRIGAPVTGHTSAVFAVAFAPDGHTFATAGADRRALLWDVADPTQPASLGPPLTGHAAPKSLQTAPGGQTLAFTADGRILASSGEDNAVLLWNLADAARPRQLAAPLTGYSGLPTAAAFTADGRTLATVESAGQVLLWDVSDPAHPNRLAGSRADPAAFAAFSPDVRTLALVDQATVSLWDVHEAGRTTKLSTFRASDTSIVTDIAFAPDGKTVVTTAYDSSVLLWNIADPTEPHRLPTPLVGNPAAVLVAAFSPDGRTLITAGEDRAAQLWDVSNLRQPVQAGEPLAGLTSSAAATAFTADSQTLAIATTDNKLLLWNVSEPTQPRRLGTPTALTTGRPITAVKFDESGHLLVTAGADGNVQLWDTSDFTGEPGPIIRRSCSITQGGMKPDQWARYIDGLDYEDACASP